MRDISDLAENGDFDRLGNLIPKRKIALFFSIIILL